MGPTVTWSMWVVRTTRSRCAASESSCGEIEYHLREFIPQAADGSRGNHARREKDNAMLAAFLQLDDKQRDAQHAGKLADNGSAVQVIFTPEVDIKMADRLPTHMQPDVYFAIPKLPMTISGKTNRKRLREIGASFSASSWPRCGQQARGRNDFHRPRPSRRCRSYGLRYSNITPESIGLDDSFFRLGGDSVVAIKLASEARKIKNAADSRGRIP